MKVLAQADLAATRREGNAIFYRRALPHTDLLGGKLHASLLEEVDNLSLPTDVQSRIARFTGNAQRRVRIFSHGWLRSFARSKT